MKNLLFVYGTLCKEYAPPEIADAVQQMKYLCKGFVHGRLYDLGEYPAAILDNSAQAKIYGRVYKLPPDASVLEELDGYEEFYPHKSSQSLFVRKQTVVTLENGKKVKSWIYEYNRAVTSKPLIKTGDYSTVQAA